MKEQREPKQCVERDCHGLQCQKNSKHTGKHKHVIEWDMVCLAG